MYGSNQIIGLVQTLKEGWMVFTGKWTNATAAAPAENTSESLKTSAEDLEDGFPAPPQDEEALLATETAGIDSWQFVDGMDLDENPRNSKEFNKNGENVRKPSLENQSIAKRKQHLPDDSLTPVKDKRVEQSMKQEVVVKKQASVVIPNMPSSGNSNKRRHPMSSVDQIADNEMMPRRNNYEVATQRNPLAHQRNQNVNTREIRRTLPRVPFPFRHNVNIREIRRTLPRVPFPLRHNVNIREIRRTLPRVPFPLQHNNLRFLDAASIRVRREEARRRLQYLYRAHIAKRQRKMHVLQL